MFGHGLVAGLIAGQIAANNEQLKRDQQELARLAQLPPQQAALEIQYRQMRAMERQASQRPQINVKTSLF